MSAAATSRAAGGRKFQLTERDLAMAEFIDRVGRATMDQVRARFGLSKRVAWRRLQALQESGRIQAWRPYVGPAILYPGGAGEPRLRDLEHCLAATLVAIQLELRRANVVTERMMQREERLAGDRSLWSIPVSSASDPFRKLSHRPDLAVRTKDGLAAIEVELTRKGKQRLARLLRGWACQAKYREVLYPCRSRELEELVTKQARESGAEQVVRATLLRHSMSSVPVAGSRSNPGVGG